MFLGIDIGGTRLKAARVDASGCVHAAQILPSPATLPAFLDAARSLATGLGAGTTAAGIGCKGRLRPGTTRVEALPGTMHYLEGQDLAELFPVRPAFADNDARVALRGERRWGAARGFDHILMITLGTGVGGGVISHSRILEGAAGAAGHIGHYTVDPDGLPCICGNRGCLETVFSARAIEAAAFDAIHRGVPTTLPPGASCDQVFQAAHAGDAVAAGIIHRATRALAGALAGLCFILDPEIIVIGGQIAEAGDILMTPLRSAIDERTRPFLRRDIPLRRAAITDGAVGAAALALESTAPQSC